MGHFLFTSYMCIAVILFIATIQYCALQEKFTTLTRKECMVLILSIFVLSIFFPITIIIIILDDSPIS